MKLENRREIVIPLPCQNIFIFLCLVQWRGIFKYHRRVFHAYHSQVVAHLTCRTERQSGLTLAKLTGYGSGLERKQWLLKYGKRYADS